VRAHWLHDYVVWSEILTRHVQKFLVKLLSQSECLFGKLLHIVFLYYDLPRAAPFLLINVWCVDLLIVSFLLLILRYNLDTTLIIICPGPPTAVRKVPKI
jgi:hypothetical protein